MNDEQSVSYLKYLILKLFKHWYMHGKTTATMAEVYNELDIFVDENTPGYDPNAVFEIDPNIMDLEDELIELGIEGRLN